MESKPESTPAASKLPTGADPVNLDPANFSADITHPYWPMTPGTRWTYREVDEKGEAKRSSSWPPQATRSLPTVSRPGWSATRALVGGHIVEDTTDWYAQDAAGNVWYMGEGTAEFENGKVVSRAGSFEAGGAEHCRGSSCPQNLR